MKKLLSFTLALLLIAQPLWAVTYDTTTSNQKTGSGTTLTKAHIVTAGGSNRAIFVGCGLDSNTITLTATYAGAAMEEVRRDQHGTNGTSTWIFKKLAPATGSNNWVVTQSVADNMICYAVSATDVDQIIGISDHDGSCPAGGAATSATVTLTAGTSDLLMDILGQDNTGHTNTEGADQTNRMSLTEGTAYQAAGSTQPGTADGVMSWSWTGGAGACLSAIAIKNFVAATRPIAPIFFQ